MNRLLACVAVALLSLGAVAHADTLDDIKKAGKVRIAIDTAIPPFGMTDDKMQPTGSDVETGRLLAQDLGVQFELVPTTGASRIPSLQTGKADVVISTLSVTAERAKVINQAIVGTTYVLMAEALMLAEAAGIDAARLPQCLAGGHADGALLQQLYPRMQARVFEPPLAYARQLLKDMLAVQDEVRGHGLDLPLIARAIEQHRAHVAQGNEMADPASIVRLYERKPPDVNNTGRVQ